MVRRVALNAAIDSRGASGTATALRQIRTVVTDWDGWEARDHSSTRRARTRVGRLLSSMAWDLSRFAREARHANESILVFPTNAGRRLRGQRSAVVIHDVMVLDHAALFDPGFVAAARFMLPVAVASNDIVVTPSEAAARAIRRRFSPRRLVVIPWFGPDRRRAILPLAERKARVLVVAPSDGHKRLHLAIEAVAAARSLTGAKLALHIIGREGTGEALLRQSLERFDPGGQFVSRAQRVSDGELQLAYANAFAVMVPSIDEGFGLPLLEAAAHGTPVIHTRLGAMNEVLPIPGEAADCGVLDLTAQLVSSLDEDAWTHAQANGFRALQRHSQEEFIARWRAVLTELDHAN